MINPLILGGMILSYTHYHSMDTARAGVLFHRRIDSQARRERVPTASNPGLAPLVAKCAAGEYLTMSNVPKHLESMLVGCEDHVWQLGALKSRMETVHFSNELDNVFLDYVAVN